MVSIPLSEAFHAAYLAHQVSFAVNEAAFEVINLIDDVERKT